MAKTTKQQIRVLLADDHAIFRDGLRKLLDSDEDITIVGEAQNGAECIKLLAKLKPDILLLDLRMPDKDGLAVLEEVNFDTLPTRVVVLTAAEDDRDVVRAMRLGARGVVLKQSATDLLVKSIHRVHAGEIWLDNRMTAEVMKAFSKSSESGPRREKPLLSDREKEISVIIASRFIGTRFTTDLQISRSASRLPRPYRGRLPGRAACARADRSDRHAPLLDRSALAASLLRPKLPSRPDNCLQRYKQKCYARPESVVVRPSGRAVSPGAREIPLRYVAFAAVSAVWPQVIRKRSIQIFCMGRLCDRKTSIFVFLSSF